mmetsp:Transcript_7426/g.16116  ORF Transcript_7426/g.16116 Transcript_7426/m.16116 type:complete len:237 (-) Transcript_7426:7-717(-)
MCVLGAHVNGLIKGLGITAPDAQRGPELCSAEVTWSDGTCIVHEVTTDKAVDRWAHQQQSMWVEVVPLSLRWQVLAHHLQAGARGPVVRGDVPNTAGCPPRGVAHESHKEAAITLPDKVVHNCAVGAADPLHELGVDGVGVDVIEQDGGGVGLEPVPRLPQKGVEGADSQHPVVGCGASMVGLQVRKWGVYSGEDGAEARVVLMCDVKCDDVVFDPHLGGAGPEVHQYTPLQVTGT